MFAGIGGLDLAVPDAHMVWACEMADYPRRVLRRRFGRGVQLYRDVRQLDPAALPTVDVLTAGFPCPDISVAGTGAGITGERSGLYAEVVRVTDGLRPARVLLENVAAISSRGLDQVIAAFHAIGYAMEWVTVTALAAGAYHRRARWFAVAYPDRPDAPELLAGLTEDYRRAFIANRAPRGIWATPPPFGMSPTVTPHEIPSARRRAALEAFGNAVVPQQAAPIGERLFAGGQPFAGGPVFDMAGAWVDAQRRAEGTLSRAMARHAEQVAGYQCEVASGVHGWFAPPPPPAPTLAEHMARTWPRLPRAGVARGGYITARPEPVPLALAMEWHAAASGEAVWPTSTANDARNGARHSTGTSVSHTGTTLVDRARLYPTPVATAYDSNVGGAAGRVGPVRYSLEGMARRGLMPTPVAADKKGARGRRSREATRHAGERLTDAARVLPTPTAADGTSGSGGSTRQGAPALRDIVPTIVKGDARGAGPGQHTASLGRSASRGEFGGRASGALSPEFVCRLMGYPPGWWWVWREQGALIEPDASERPAEGGECPDVGGKTARFYLRRPE